MHINRRLYQIVLIVFLIAGTIAIPNSLRARSDDTIGGASTPQSPFVLRVYYEDVRDLDRLSEFTSWDYNNRKDGYVLVSADGMIYELLLAEGWSIVIDQRATDALLRTGRVGSIYSEGYRTVDELYALMEQTASENPEFLELVDYGDSHCKSIGGCITPGNDNLAGYDLLALRVTNESLPGTSVVTQTEVIRGSKPVFFLMANIHAREISTPEIAIRFLESLLNEYDSNPDTTWLVDHHEIWIIPTANPDGLWQVGLGTDPKYGGMPFSQRKNTNQDANEDGINDCSQWPPQAWAQYGVDLNRNHSFGWGLAGVSREPCSLIYHGPSPASEIEVSSLEILLSSLFPDQRGPELTDAAPMDTTGIFITLHSYSNLVLWPWGQSYQSAPNREGLEAIGKRLAEFNGYEPDQASGLYPASGGSDDWAYGVLGIPSFTFEIGYEFMPPYSEIDSTQWPENKPALYFAAAIARAPYQTILGPEIVGDIEVSQVGGLIQITATVDDSNNGSNSIQAAALRINNPFWDEIGIDIIMTPTDGVFDSSNEEISGLVDPRSMSIGRNLIYLRGQDSDGNWGGVRAIFIEHEEVTLNYWHIPIILVPSIEN